MAIRPTPERLAEGVTSAEARLLGDDWIWLVKRCSKCGLYKSLDQFYKDSQKSDGLCSHCKKCHRSTPCSIPGCDKHAVSRGYCAMHAWRERERGSVFWEPQRPGETPPGHKFCPACGQVKPHAAFSRCSSTADGLQSACKDCRREMQRKGRAKAREAGRVPSYEVSVESKRCANCDLVKPATAFSLNRANRDGLFAWCKECWQERDRSYYATNPERGREKTRNWRIKNPEKAKATYAEYVRTHRQKVYAKHRIRRARRRKAEGFHTADDIRRLYDEQKGLCYYCGVPLNGHFHVDHKQPVSKNGSEWPVNLACTCVTCNLSKSDMTEQEFLDKITRLEWIKGKSWAQIAADAGLDPRTLSSRIEHGWSLEEAVSTPVRPYGQTAAH